MTYVALVTGASRGIGRAAAVSLAQRGATVAVHFNASPDAAQETLASMKAAPEGAPGHAVFQADVSKPDECQALIASVVEKYGRIDALVNNAGILRRCDEATCSYEEFCEMAEAQFTTNVASAANLTFLVAKQMAAQGPALAALPGDCVGDCRGRVVMVASRAAYRGAPTCMYSSSKAAMSTLGQTLARTLGPQKIGVYVVAPTFVDTDMAHAAIERGGDAITQEHPIGRIPTVGEAGDAIATLLQAPLATSGSIMDLNSASHVHH